MIHSSLFYFNFKLRWLFQSTPHFVLLVFAIEDQQFRLWQLQLLQAAWVLELEVSFLIVELILMGRLLLNFLLDVSKVVTNPFLFVLGDIFPVELQAQLAVLFGGVLIGCQLVAKVSQSTWVVSREVRFYWGHYFHQENFVLLIKYLFIEEPLVFYQEDNWEGVIRHFEFMSCCHNLDKLLNIL